MVSDTPTRVLFRTWSSKSAGVNSRQGCLSGNQNQRNFTIDEMIQTFNNHRNLDNRNPTFFISTTDDPIRALSIAIKKDFCGEEDVQVAIIRSDAYILGEELASAFGLNSCLFQTEFLFLWEIKASEIMHVVPLKTLISRGLYKRCPVLDPSLWVDVEQGLPSLPELRRQICENNEDAYEPIRTWPERSGRYVLAIAKCFGDDVPLRAIASLIWGRGTHFEPDNYWDDELHLRVRDAIEQSLRKNRHHCAYDEWFDELADDEDEED
jgi:hypothetical protein